MGDREKREEIWIWICRTLGVTGFVALLLSDYGYNVPKWFYFLLISLLFGPEIFVRIFDAIRGRGGGSEH